MNKIPPLALLLVAMGLGSLAVGFMYTALVQEIEFS